MKKENIENFFPNFKKLSDEVKEIIKNKNKIINFKKGEIIHQGNYTCIGLILIIKGTLRSYLTSKTGREITLYRLYDNDICLFSTSCAIRGITTDMIIECEEDTLAYLIKPETYKLLNEKSVIFKEYINNILSCRFSDVMFVFEQSIFQSVDKRIASYLLEIYEGIDINITHEKIAKEIASAREVVSRTLKSLEKDKVITLSRNKITINDLNKLKYISEH